MARASVATKLAMIYLLDHKPAQALKTLNDTRQTRLPDDVNEQRRATLEARRDGRGLKRYDAALDILADDDSLAIKRLRADIYWDSGNWAVAGSKMEVAAGRSLEHERRPLPMKNAASIMRAAVAYSLGGNEAGLAKLREHYAEKMRCEPGREGLWRGERGDR